MSLIDREQILTMIPHSGSMCLLDGVLAWDEASVRCISRRYRNQDNPMRRADCTLGTASGIEIAAQAMAVHGRLTSCNSDPPRRGYLAGLRDVCFHNRRLDAAEGELVVMAERLMGDARGASYRFALTVQGAGLLSGRATVFFEVPE